MRAAAGTSHNQDPPYAQVFRVLSQLSGRLRRGAKGDHQPCGVPGGAAGELIPLHQHHILPASLGEVVRHTAPDDAASNHNNTRLRGLRSTRRRKHGGRCGSSTSVHAANVSTRHGPQPCRGGRHSSPAYCRRRAAADSTESGSQHCGSTHCRGGAVVVCAVVGFRLSKCAVCTCVIR